MNEETRELLESLLPAEARLITIRDSVSTLSGLPEEYEIIGVFVATDPNARFPSKAIRCCDSIEGLQRRDIIVPEDLVHHLSGRQSGFIAVKHAHLESVIGMRRISAALHAYHLRDRTTNKLFVRKHRRSHRSPGERMEARREKYALGC